MSHSQFTSPSNVRHMWSILMNQPPFNSFVSDSETIQTLWTIFESNIQPFAQCRTDQLQNTSDLTDINNTFISTIIKFVHTSRRDLLTCSSPEFVQTHQDNQAVLNAMPGPINTRAAPLLNNPSQPILNEDFKTQNRKMFDSAVAARAGEYAPRQNVIESTTAPFAELSQPAPSSLDDDMQKLISQRGYDIEPGTNSPPSTQLGVLSDNNIYETSGCTQPQKLGLECAVISNSETNIIDLINTQNLKIDALSTQVTLMCQTQTEILKILTTQQKKKSSKHSS